MIKAQRATRFLLYSVWAVVMTALTYVLGAVSLKMLRRKFGRVGYWGVMTLISALLFAVQMKALGVAFFSLVVLMGVFSELEEMDLSFSVSLLFTLIINTLLASGAFALWVYSTGPRWQQSLMTFLESLFKPLAEMNPQLEMNYYELMLVLPSVILILWTGAVYVSILLESRLTAGREGAVPAMRRQLGEFRLPDAAVWLFIAALLGGFGGFENKAIEAVSANVLNVCLMLFFLQGIAVVGRLFDSLRMSAFWQTLFMIMIVIYLFLFVSLLGLMDYWFDFRARLAKRSEEFNRET